MTDTARSPLRNQLLDAAYDLVVEHGWAKLRLTHIAKAAEVGRAVVHDHFPSLDAVGEELVAREIERFLGGIVDELSKHPDDLRESAAEGVGFALRFAAENPLLNGAVSSAVGGDRALLSPLTTRSESVFDCTYALIAGYVDRAWPQVSPERRRLMVDAAVRLTISHIMAPSVPVPVAARDIADIAAYIAGVNGVDGAGGAGGPAGPAGPGGATEA
ncbi:TetR family transcriptional regulator [Kitasatospora sp. NPDC058032]|uniref:TetR/AcrR family transcriptional regulator n=1 Tax=Kitasatospora sp. NPDC058032 TaxID=3346307 RepID=UPI0036DD13D0